MQNERERVEIELSQWLTAQGVSWDGELSDIQKLTFRHRQLTSLPESICQLTNLEDLILENNKLTSLPESICQLPNLDCLWIKQCKLAILPESIGNITSIQLLSFIHNEITILPESIGQLDHLQLLNLSDNQLTSLPESLGDLTNLKLLHLSGNQLTTLPDSIGKLSKLRELDLSHNQLTSLPESIGQLTNLSKLYLSNNPLTDLSPLQRLTQDNLEVRCFGVELSRRYWTKFSDWQPEWLLDEDNAEIRRVLIQQLGYEKICDTLGAETIDIWREYTLLKIDNIQAVYNNIQAIYKYDDEPSHWAPLVMLKMTCPSTAHIHILRVPPEMTSAETAITWVNHGIHPDKISIQT